MDLGAGRRGVDMGPSAIRVARLQARLEALGYEVEDLGNVAVEQPESRKPGKEYARYLKEIASTCARLAASVEQAMDRSRFPIVLGGDHSIGVGTVAGVARHFARHGKKLGLIWIDAHADMNTPVSSPSGNVHGMPLACIAGKGPKELVRMAGTVPMVAPANIAMVGLRDVDSMERGEVKGAGVHAFTMRDIDERGLRQVIGQAVEAASAGTAGFHVSFDLDSIDPREAPGVGTPVRGGLTYREAHLALELICDAHGMTSLELVEVNPVLDISNRTAELAVELALSALGKRIL
jgi:arginase